MSVNTTHYRSAAFLYYSGTGSSRRVAVWLAQSARDRACGVVLAPIRAAHPEDDVGHGNRALLSLIFPTHGFTVPWAVLRCVASLPRRKNTHAVVVATRGALKIGGLSTLGFEGTATLIVALVLTLKGYVIRGTVGIDMPSNWTALHPSLPPRAIVDIIARARSKTAQFSDAILSGKRRPPNYSRQRSVLPCCRPQRPTSSRGGPSWSSCSLPPLNARAADRVPRTVPVAP